MSIGKRISGFAVLVLLCAAMIGAATPTFAADASRAVASAPVTGDEAGALYSERGAATCMQCHNEAPVTDILKTAHAVKGDVHSPFGQHDANPAMERARPTPPVCRGKTCSAIDCVQWPECLSDRRA